MFSKENILERLVIINNKRILISYKGPITPVIMSEISRDIQDKLADNPKASRKMFSVFIELAQNILYYSVEKIQYAGRIESVGMLQIVDMDNYYLLTCGNTVKKSEMEELVKSCNTINSLDRVGLRKLKCYQRRQPPYRNSKGAGIGLVQVAILADNPLEIHVHEVDAEHSFFTLAVNINK